MPTVCPLRWSFTQAGTSVRGLWGSGTLQLGLALALTVAHLRYPKLHALQAAILLDTLVIVWLGLSLP